MIGGRRQAHRFEPSIRLSGIGADALGVCHTTVEDQRQIMLGVYLIERDQPWC
jgi:hypothetical protein